MKNETDNQNKKWWQFKKMNKKDYGRVAIVGLLLVFIKSVISPVHGLPPIHWVFELLSDVIIIMGLVSGILWLKEEFNVNKKNKAKIIFFIVVLMFFGILGLIEDENKKKEQEKVIQEIGYTTETALESMKVEHEKLKATFDNVDLSDLLEHSSLKNIERMREITYELNLLMVSWEEHDKKILESANNMRDDVINMAIKDLGEIEGKKVYLSSKEYFDRNFIVAEKYNNAGRDYFNEVILLYNFLIANYDDYEIDYDEYGEENVYFYSKNNAYKFNQYMKKIDKLYDNYVLLEKEI